MDIEGQPVYIFVDDREQAGAVPAALARRRDATIEVARLSVGDYCVQRRVLVERKTAADFAASLIDGRLFRQAAALAAAPHREMLRTLANAKAWQEREPRE